MTQEAAHRALLSFLQRSRKSGLRLTLVVTGKGNPEKRRRGTWMMRSHGVLKDMVPRWLNEPDFAALIAGSARRMSAMAATARFMSICENRNETGFSYRQRATHGPGFMRSPTLADFLRGEKTGWSPVSSATPRLRC